MLWRRRKMRRTWDRRTTRSMWPRTGGGRGRRRWMEAGRRPNIFLSPG